MGTSYNPHIVSDGLVLCLDAANPRSYPVGPELWDGTVSPTVLNFGGTTGYYDIATKTMHSPTSAANVDRPRFTFNLGLTAGKLYSIVGTLSGDLDDLTTGGRVNPNIALNTTTGEINTTFTAVNESIWFVFNANFSPSSVTIESLSVREVTSVWKDLSGNGNNGTFGSGTAAPTFSGDNGGVLSFDGSNDYVSGTNNITLQLVNDLTVFAWVKLGDAANQGIVEKMNSSYNGYGITKQNGFFKFWTASNNNYTYTNSNTTYVADNNWYHVVGRRMSGTNRLFINSILQSDSQSAPLSDSGQIYVVGRYYSNVDNFYLGGNISQVSIYNRALTVQEIRQNFNATRGRYGN